MSYKAAWDAVDAVNRAWGAPLVESNPAGSALTADAKLLIAAFHEAEVKHRDFMIQLAETLPDKKTIRCRKAQPKPVGLNGP